MNRGADPGPVSQVHLQNRDLLFSHMLLFPLTHYSACVDGNMHVSVVTVCVGTVCVYPDTGSLCSPAGRLIRSYSNNQLYFTSLSLSLFLPTHSLCVTQHPHPILTTTTTTTSHQNRRLETIHQPFPFFFLCFFFLFLWGFFLSLVLTDRSNRGSLSPVLTLISIH